MIELLEAIQSINISLNMQMKHDSNVIASSIVYWQACEQVIVMLAGKNKET